MNFQVNKSNLKFGINLFGIKIARLPHVGLGIRSALGFSDASLKCQPRVPFEQVCDTFLGGDLK